VKRYLLKQIALIRRGISKVTSSKKRLAYFIITFGILAFIGSIIPSFIVISYGGSINHHVLWKVSRDPLLNDYISIATSPSDPFAKGATITKQVVCTPGMKLTVTKDKKYFCDGQFIGKAKDKSKTGKEVENYTPCINRNQEACEIIIPDGCYFAVGHNPDSYDSRYIGLIKKEDIVAVSVPVW